MNICSFFLIMKIVVILGVDTGIIVGYSERRGEMKKIAERTEF